MESRNRHGICAAMVFCGLYTACDIDTTLIAAPDDPINVRIGEKGSSCPIWQCGFNAAEVFGGSIHELQLDGAANSAGMQLLQVIPAPAAAAGGFVDFAVAGDAFVLRNGKGKALKGAGLVGTELLLGHDGVPFASVRIASHSKVPRWAEGSPDADAYGLVYVIDGVERNVCTGSELDNPRVSTALILGDETYDLEAKRVRPGATRWFSIACAGSAAAKMSLLGYGPQSSKTSAQQRQATLKMITADYCGGGHSYTKDGTAVLWENIDGTVELTAEPDLIESVWTSSGARCLDATRIAGTNIACKLPSCDAFDLEDGEWLTYVPIAQ